MVPCVSAQLLPRPVHFAGHLTTGRARRRRGQRGNKPCVAAASGEAPSFCWPIRRFGPARRPITGSELCPLLRRGAHRAGRPAGHPGDDGGTSGHKVRVTAGTAGNGGERRGTAGNGGERLGLSLPAIGSARSAGRDVGSRRTALGNSAPAHSGRGGGVGAGTPPMDRRPRSRRRAGSAAGPPRCRQS